MRCVPGVPIPLLRSDSESDRLHMNDCAKVSRFVAYDFSSHLPTLQQRWQPPKVVGYMATDPIVTGGSFGVLVHDLTPYSSARDTKGSGSQALLSYQV